MEFELNGDSTSLIVKDRIEIKLPRFMTMLSTNELTNVQNSVNKDKLIIAVGKKTDNEIVFLTGTCKVMTLKLSNNETFPKGFMTLNQFGSMVIINDDVMTYCIESINMIENAIEVDITII